MSQINTAVKEREQWRAKITRALEEFREGEDRLVRTYPPRDDANAPATSRSRE